VARTHWLSVLVLFLLLSFVPAPGFAGDGQIQFVRGDVSADFRIEISDAIRLFGFLFLGTAAPPCLDAADSNDSGALDLSDGIYILAFLFLGGAAPPQPYPNCGLDPTEDPLGCDRFRACICGGIAGFPCPDGFFCEFPAGTCDIADNLGTCVEVPELCPAIFDPVCGCDGVTYANDCERRRAGAQKDHDGPCGKKTCGGIAGEPCPPGSFCEFPPGTCDIVDNQGTCVEVPELCPDVFDPVCGCDGVTYSNDCERRRAMAQKAHDGPCEDRVCGGIAGIPCPDGFFCEFPPGTCDIADNQGACVEIPEACPRIFDPVCGCDGVTYSNDCERRRAGAQKAHDGPCEDRVCGGIAGIPCPEGFFCEFPSGTCDIADNQGTCVEVPEACIAIFDPVCGCDGVTYSNDCERQRAGAQKAHDGPCEDKVCGGFIGVPCPEGFFCEFPPGTCNVADNQGTCVEVPELCPAIFDPVCGCDRVTYGNDCERQRAGAQKNHDGPCQRQ
jgi:hypothetical protein